MYMEVQLHTCKNIFKRLWVALKYIFGYKCAYGTWDSFIFGKEEEIKLYEFLKGRHDPQSHEKD